MSTTEEQRAYLREWGRRQRRAGQLAAARRQREYPAWKPGHSIRRVRRGLTLIEAPPAGEPGAAREEGEHGKQGDR